MYLAHLEVVTVLGRHYHSAVFGSKDLAKAFIRQVNETANATIVRDVGKEE